MSEWFTDFFRDSYDAPIVFVWGLGVWFVVSMALAVAKFACRSNKRLTKSVNRIRSSSDIYGFSAFVFSGLLIPIDAYVTDFGDWHMSENPLEWGPIGDFFGGMLNPILAFASFIALLYTIRIQSEELRLTKEELARSADAHERSEANMREQIRLAKQQNEMNFHHNLLSGIEGRLHELLNAQMYLGKVPLDPYKKIVRGCFSLAHTDKDATRAITSYSHAEEQDYRLKDVRYEVVLLLARFSNALHDYHNKFGQTSVSFNYIIQYVELVAVLHALKIINAREGDFQIFNIDEFYISVGINSWSIN